MTARDVAAMRIARRARQFPDLELVPLDTSSLAPRDAALAGAIDHAVARRWLTLVAVLEHHLSRPWDEVETKLQAVLLTGAAQLLFLDRVPDHAVIDESAEIAKRRIRAGAAGLVNAVLRGIARQRVELVARHEPGRRDEIARSDGRAWRLGADVLDAEPRTRLAQQTSHPFDLLSRWHAGYGERRTTVLAYHGLVDPPIIVADPTGTVPGTPHDEPGFTVWDGSVDELGAALERAPGARVQDPTSARPVAATAGLTPRRIIDACAGRGTKTRQLAELHPEATIIATDRDDARRAALAATFAGSSRVQVVAPGDLIDQAGQADLLLLDVPCSNTGVLARRVEARYRVGPETVAGLQAVQRQIMADTLGLVAPGGVLLYATCSIEPEENAAQADWLTRWHPFDRIDARSRLPAGQPGDPAHGYRDGGYFALFRRRPD